VTAPHLDDTQLSSLLDEGLDDDHLSSCRACDARLRALRSARDALASAAVAPLPAATLDEMVAQAIAALDEPVTTPAAARGSRRPPPSWLLAAAAAIAVLTGVAGLVRMVSPNVSSTDSATSAADDESEGLAADLQTKAESGGASFDPEVVGADLGEQSDPALLTAVLNQTDPTVAVPAASSARAAGQKADEASPAMPPAPTTTIVDRARCRSAAERVGAGQLGVLQSTSLVRWKGSMAEVLVFTLAEPAAGFTRQALVLRRPDCVLLADPRF
jgi:hypothetical protein